ncbi:hypothetical protein FGO68_gene9540 [Halteria grandinella]|uniref:Uncharacterized protein n=1 Tax=Halteria grandinella TaxID=5974 RepID=A0A8J8NGW1_HALGN|nr:hypothetical protein FGO68_gene9540 [Halteria grandinella]
MLLTLHASIITNHVKQPETMEGIKFLCDLPRLRRSFPQNQLLEEISQEQQVEHLCITFLKRLNTSPTPLPNNTGLLLAQLHRMYPYLLDPKNSQPQLHRVQPQIFSQNKAFLRFQEAIWNEKMSRGRGQALKWQLMAGVGVFVVFNVWVLWRRVAFYMEHSFDILNPDIDYIINRY